jgi:hypothetical protein
MESPLVLRGRNSIFRDEFQVSESTDFGMYMTERGRVYLLLTSAHPRHQAVRKWYVRKPYLLIFVVLITNLQTRITVREHTISQCSVLAGGEWSALRPSRFTPGERAPGTHWVDPRAGLGDVGKRKFLTLLGLKLRLLGRPTRSQSLSRLLELYLRKVENTNGGSNIKYASTLRVYISCRRILC